MAGHALRRPGWRHRRISLKNPRANGRPGQPPNASSRFTVGQLRELERQPPAPLQQAVAVAHPSGNEERRLEAEHQRVAAQTLHDWIKRLCA